MTMTIDLRIETRHVGGAAVVEPHGVLDTASYGTLRSALVKASSDEPRAVVVDVAGLRVPKVAALALFFAVSDQIAQWPGVPLLLVAARPVHRGQLDHYRTSQYIPVHRSVAGALAAIDDPPPRRIARRQLPNSLVSARLARLFVARKCAEWDQHERAEDAVSIANELVENTLLHTYSAPALRVELRRGMLTVAVYDSDPTPATLRAGTRCRGLRLVEGLSRTWGCSPMPTGGKVVWAVL
jgi:anti-anti-sigma regulatory factor